MGIQGTNIADVTGASVLVIEQACENSQLLVSLCRNGNQWLSPVGWTEKQKITLLDCRSQGGKTEIDIPAEFSKTLVSGDTLLLKCSELDLTQEVVWETSNLQTRPVADLTPASTSLAGGLLSRFKSSKVGENTDTKSEAQLRADEADVAAESYRAKMEAATAAKEDAQRRSLEASREAEAALKMEAERIADMERAAKAFEEAERLKQDGLRRVEDERRQEKARIAEEARRLEEESKRAEAAKLEIERKAALERFESALEATKNEDMRLQNRLVKLKTDAGALEIKQSETSTTLSALNGNMEAVQNKVDIARAAFQKTASELNDLNVELTALQSKSEGASAESAEIADRVAGVEAEYLTAQREAEMAIARAEEKRSLLDAARADKETVLSSLNTLSKTLETQAGRVTETTRKSQNLQSKFEAAQADLADKTTEIETLENDKRQISDSIQTRRLEIEATQQAVEDCHVRLTSHQKSITHLETGGNPENVTEFDLKTRLFEKESHNEEASLEADEILLEDAKPSEGKSGLFGRVRRSFSRSKDVEISTEVEDVKLIDETRADELDTDVMSGEAMLETPTDDATFVEELESQYSIEDIIAEPELKTAGFVRRHSKSLLAIGTILGGATILGGGFIASQTKHPEVLSAKSAHPTATKYASSTAEIKIPAIAAPVLTPVIKSPLISQDLSVKSLPKVSIEAIALDIPDIPIANLTLTGLSLDAAPATTKNIKTAAITAPVKKPIKTSVEAPLKTSLKTVTIKAEDPKNYPVLTTRVQRQLQTLGFYTGPLNGRKTKQTTEAIKTFQAVNQLPQHGRMSGNFLTSLVKAEAQYSSALKYANVASSVNAPVQAPQSGDFQSQNIKVVEASFSAPVFSDTVRPVTTTPVVTKTLLSPEVYNSASEVSSYGTQASTIQDRSKDVAGALLLASAVPSVQKSDAMKVATGLVVVSSIAAQNSGTKKVAAGLAFAPSIAALQPNSKIVKEATAPRVSTPRQASTAQDVVVDAIRTRAAKAGYPRAAAVKNYFADVRIVVGYDIDPFGKVVNARVLTNDHTGRFNSSFERAAVNAVKQQRFTAKTVNGYPVGSTGKTQRIVFKGQ